MNRPPKKKKSQEGLAEDPRFSNEELAAAPSSKSTPKAADSEGDDRNLVEIDDAFTEADIEDRAWLFWQRNKTGVILGALILILGVGGVNTWQLVQASSFENMQADFSAAVGDDAKLQSFGTDNLSSPLGGVALLQLADKKYADGDYEGAAPLYLESLQPLQNTMVLGRAQLGLGMAQIKAGQQDAGRSTLSALVADPTALEAVRGEALFELGQLELMQGNRDAAKSWLDQAVALENAEIWKSQAERLLDGEGLADPADDSEQS
ncbi:MAG: tetratricopeptide repeat protein [Verrucomicrobiota bacterium]